MMHMDEPCPDRAVTFPKVQITHYTGGAVVSDASLTSLWIPLVRVDQYFVHGAFQILATDNLFWALDRRLHLLSRDGDAPDDLNGRGISDFDRGGDAGVLKGCIIRLPPEHMNAASSLHDTLDAWPAKVRPIPMVPTKTTSLPAIPVVVPGTTFGTDVGKDQELAHVFHDPSIPLPASRVCGNARGLLDVCSRVGGSSVELQHEGFASVRISTSRENICLAALVSLPPSLTSITMLPCISMKAQ